MILYRQNSIENDILFFRAKKSYNSTSGKGVRYIMKRTHIEAHIFKGYSKMNGIIPQDEAGIILSGLVFIKLYSLAAWEKLKELNGYSINLYIRDFFTNENLPFNEKSNPPAMLGRIE